MNDKDNNVLNSLYNEDGTVKAPYVDQNDTGKFATSVSTENVGVDQDDINSNLGGGLKAAGEMNYSWDTKAQERASLDYKSQVLDTKNQFLTSRQQTESQGKAYQEQVDMQKYSQNQSIDKVGWTGGYVLDTERQMNYLKESIKAQMYGQMELQKYGYETSLAAARLAYDTNKYDLALQYYQQAITNAVTEAAQTGIYRSPEVREHLDNYKIATDILNGDAEGDKEQAAKLVENIHSWFKDQGISPAGIKTLERIQIDADLAAKKQAQITAMYEQYNIKAENKYKIDIDSFGKINADGSMAYTTKEDGTIVPEIIDFNTLSTQKLLEYAASNETAKQQVYGYFEGKMEQDIQSYLSYAEKGTDANGEPVYNITSEGFKKYLEANGFKDIQKIYSELKNSDQHKGLLSDWKTEFQINSTPIYLSITESGDINIDMGTLEDSWIKNEEQKAQQKIEDDKNYLRNNLQDEYKNKVDLNRSYDIYDSDLSLDKFGDFKSGSEQSEYYNNIIKMAKSGQIKNGEVVAFNYGAAWDDRGLYMFYNNRFYKVTDDYVLPTYYSSKTNDAGIASMFAKDYTTPQRSNGGVSSLLK